MENKPSGMILPFIKGNVLKANPALVPATKPPLVIISTTKAVKTRPVLYKPSCLRDRFELASGFSKSKATQRINP